MKAAHEGQAMRSTLVLRIHCSHIVIHLTSAGMRHIAVIHSHVMLSRGSSDGRCNRGSNKLKHHNANQEHKAQRPKGRSDMRMMDCVAHEKVMQPISHTFKSEIREVRIKATVRYLTS
nr:hypothetical protein [uncultured Sulfitobacter sp.]